MFDVDFISLENVYVKNFTFWAQGVCKVDFDCTQHIILLCTTLGAGCEAGDFLGGMGLLLSFFISWGFGFCKKMSKMLKSSTYIQKIFVVTVSRWNVT